MDAWVARVNHDLLKHARWRARDLEASGGAPGAADLAALRRALLTVPDGDAESGSVTARQRLRALRAEATQAAGDRSEGARDGSRLAALADAFDQALAVAETAVQRDDAAAAFAAFAAVDHAFSALARASEEP